MDKDEHILNVQEAEEHHAHELELQHQEEELLGFDTALAQENNEKFLGIACDVSQTIDFLLKYVNKSREVNCTQHTEVLKLLAKDEYIKNMEGKKNVG